MLIRNVPYCASGSKSLPNTLCGKVNLDILPRNGSIMVCVSVPGHFHTVQYRLATLEIARLAGYLEEWLKVHHPTRQGG